MKLRTLSVLLIIALAAVLTSAVAQDAPNATTIRVFTPVGAAGLAGDLNSTHELSGSCFVTSVATSERPDAWRCSAGNAILDPCFQNFFGADDELVCAEAPFSTDVVRLKLTEPLPEPSSNREPDFSGLPWALELENGAQCTLFTGATASLAGLRINYGCSDGGEVAGPVDRSLSAWRVFYRADDAGSSLDQVKVVTAWY